MLSKKGGNLVRQEDARQCVTEITYDVLDRVTRRSFDGALQACCETEDVAYYYDQQPEGIGQRTGMTDSSGWTRWHYDRRGQVTREERYLAEVGRFVTAWGYDSAGRVTWMRYPGGNQGQVGEQVSFGYLPQGAPSSVTGEAQYLANASYNAAGQPTVHSLGGGLLTTTRSYYSYTDDNHRLSAITTGSLQNLAYHYDAGGNITQITDGAETQTFGYDALDRLTQASASGGASDYSESYTYSGANDALPGRLTQKGARSLSYGSSPHPQAVTGDGTLTYAYDANGSQVTRGAQTLVYDAENHLVQAGTTRYVYNGDGQMVRKVDGSNNQTVYIGQYVEAQFNATPPPTPTARPAWTALPATATFANTPTPSATPPTRTPTRTRTPTKTVKIGTPTKTRTVNPATFTVTITRTTYSTATRTPSTTPSITNTPNPAHSPTRTRTSTRTPTSTKSITPTTVPTKTKTPTPTRTPPELWATIPTRTPTSTRTPVIPTAFPTPTGQPTPIPALIPAGQAWRFYYFAGAQRIAMRYKDSYGYNVEGYLLSDHLGSTYKTILSSGVQAGELRYKAFGETRLSSGTTPTDYRFTGQLSQMTDTGLYYYGARWPRSAPEPRSGEWGMTRR